MITYVPHSLSAVAAMFTLSVATATFANEIYTTEGVAIHGYDSVAYFREHKPVKGTNAFTASHKGATFHFSSQSNRDIFVQNPEKYAPQYGGFCAYGVARGYKAPTQPQAFTIVKDKLYLNYNDEVMQTWRADVSGYIEMSDTNWASVRTDPSP